jgi:hypothetical protein
MLGTIIAKQRTKISSFRTFALASWLWPPDAWAGFSGDKYVHNVLKIIRSSEFFERGMDIWQ